ncbi:thioredoxin domain-containing protein [Caldimonas tepidiphila]|uniref:thioredoxin domain-containing protein n=1 Tax=Caldimonas tepidiphila TaxID=2315841 RepID=UPI000E5ACDE0|nr:thioredoxin domain-containing protein [Caldimonas tepidiphila]
MENRLAGETSPYLLQHAGQPVHWQPWDGEALSAARAQDKPILLSIGYSACHWCHVMAHESFEDPDTAVLMNELFVNIKVDREERPDLDQIYQAAHLMLARRAGGWPLTAFLTPDGTPFFCGTYFPPRVGRGRPAFREVLQSVATAWQEQREAILQQNEAVLETYARSLPRPSGSPPVLDAGPQRSARERLARAYDAEHGGFGGAPKFPHPTDLAWLLRLAADEGDAGARGMALHTLGAMARGGLLDQLGGGFFRYSTDPRWEIPHFEKMLYDNGPLLALYADALALSGDACLARVVDDTAGWLLREMQHEAGGFCSSLDADSAGEEGRFYVWTPEAVRALLTPPEWAVAEPHWGLDAAPNFEGRFWHLRVARTLPELAQRLGASEAVLADRLASARGKLLAARETRLRPGRDDKVLTSWNALAIAGLARAGAVRGRPEWLAAARRALGFVRGTLWTDGRLLATWKDGRAHLDAYLDDHAWLLEALLALMQADFRPADPVWAGELAEALLARFEDPSDGGFFFTAHDHERLIHRPKPVHDSPLPAGNASAALALQRLGHLLGEPRYLRAAERTLELFAPSLAEHPGGQGRLLEALAEHLRPPTLVILRGEQAGAWRDALLAQYAPGRLVIALPGHEAALPAALARPLPPPGHTAAWVCRGTQCLAPVQDEDALRALLGPPPP